MVGSGIGGITTLLESHKVLLEKEPDRVSPFFIPMLIVNRASGLLFFFQAEDGIRYPLVTGVQTGALPIGELVDDHAGQPVERRRQVEGRRHHLARRSEERRVGKECRSRWSPDQ